LLQKIGLKVKKSILLAIIIGILFALPHVANTEVVTAFQKGIPTFLMMTSQYFIIGFLLAIITIKSNSLEMAIGAHFANNLFAIPIVETKISSVKLGTSVFYSTNNEVLFSFIAVIVISVVFYIGSMLFIKMLYPQRIEDAKETKIIILDK